MRFMILDNFTFISNDHSRYENGKIVSASNPNCNRVIEIKRIDAEEVFLVTIYNLDGDHPVWQNNIQMSPKRMKIISFNNKTINLLGIGSDFIGNSFSDYGLTIFFEMGKTKSITLQIFDRKVEINYFSKMENAMQEKHCEWCGSLTSNYFYRFIIQPNYIIFLNSPLIKSIDKNNQIVNLKNGNQVDYSALISSTMAVSYNEIFPHLFCSENCEDSYLSKHSVHYRDDIENEIAVLSLNENNIFSPIVVPIEQIKHSKEVCHQCNTGFPNFNKHFNCIKIKSMDKQKARLGDRPDMQKYPIVFSDMHDRKPDGNYFLLDIDMDQSKWAKNLFCSNECAFEYAQKENKIVMYKNNMLEGNLSIVSPYTVEINEGLNNPYKFRPQKFGRR